MKTVFELKVKCIYGCFAWLEYHVEKMYKNYSKADWFENQHNKYWFSLMETMKLVLITKSVGIYSGNSN